MASKPASAPTDSKKDKEKKSPMQELAEKLLVKKEPSWNKTDAKATESFCSGYKSFLDENKTEREATATIVTLAKKAGFKDLRTEKSVADGGAYFFATEKTVALVRFAGLEAVNVVASHMDSPRLDLKPYPLVESSGYALLKTHYYGGIKKFQYLNLPLSLRGVILRKDGSKVTLNLGGKPGEPVFIIPDLAPHVSRDQAEKSANKFVEAEQLMALAGIKPVDDKEISDKVKLAVMKHLNDKYNIIEQDFTTAELTLVPAGQAVDVGFDAGMIAAYGHDDRSSVYLSLRSILDMKKPSHTAICLFYDKEEIGSTGKSGATSSFFLDLIHHLIEQSGSKRKLRDVMADTDVLSADVTGGMDPINGDVSDPTNASFLGHGISIEKYGGAYGKYDSSDADAEYMHRLRALAEKYDIPWQTGEIAKVDHGGGGTIAMFLARHGCDVVDAGVPVLAMHSPYEIAAKNDLYEGYRFYKAFLEEN